MKYDNCPSCGGKLGIPEKRIGHPVTCPTCQDVFLPTFSADADDDGGASVEPRPKKKRKSKKTRQPNARSIPLPTVLSVGTKTNPANDLSALDHPQLSGSPALLNAPAPKRRSRKNDKDFEHEVGSDSKPHVKQDLRKTGQQTGPKPDVTARIKKPERVEPQVLEDGSLPTLQLKDNKPEKSTEFELKSSPIFIGALICFSLVSSGLMLFFVDLSSTENATTHREARIKIERYYEQHGDKPLKPYQIELRAAQLAASRGNREAEIRAYRKVMARFRAEDRNQFIGVTGLPSEDEKLKRLVSILLNDSK